MVILHINAGFAGSIKKLINGIISSGSLLTQHYLAAPNRRKEKIVFENYIKVGNILDRAISRLFFRIFGLEGYTNYFSTLKLVHQIKRLKPDVIHLHILHGNYINIILLFKYLSTYQGKVIWTLHDTWAFTGKCVHFDSVNCTKWVDGCNNCPLLNKYPKSYFDNTKLNYLLKKKLFNLVPNIQFVTPSKWLEGKFLKSYLKDNKVTTIYNSINLDLFKPKKSDFRIKNSISENAFIILAVAFNFSIEKGIAFLHDLALVLDNRFKIVIVGNVDFKNVNRNNDILYINRTESSDELINIYSSANVFFNPTLEEVFGLVNLEALACGIPVITFNSGGSPEVINLSTGIVIQKNDIQEAVKAIEHIYFNKPYSVGDCLSRAKALGSNNLEKYINIYKNSL